jgi:3-dehydroquinate synthase
MQTIQQIVRTEFRYAIHFTRGVFDAQNVILRNILTSESGLARVLFVIDDALCTPERSIREQIEQYCVRYPGEIENVADPLVVPGGETAKNGRTYVDKIRNLVNTHGICRHSFIVAVGGGAVLDMAGYAAATAHRGVRLIRLPTTVLAQNDSGLGVKTSVNRFGKKNFLGTFTPPFAVINDFDFLDTLSDRDWRAGTAEAVKVALIKDAAFFNSIEESAVRLATRDAQAMERLIYRCAELHLAHIAGGDPFETGSSRPLDFGHWAAHKLEQLSGFRLKHGEAVAIGISLDTTYSYLSGLLDENTWLRITRTFLGLDLPIYSSELEQPELLNGLTEFREHLGGELTILLLKGIGEPIEVHSVNSELIRKSVEHLKQFEDAPFDASVCSA